MKPTSESSFGADIISYLCLKRQEDKCNDASVLSVQKEVVGVQFLHYKWRDEASGETHRSSKYKVGEAGGAPEVPVKRLFF